MLILVFCIMHIFLYYEKGIPSIKGTEKSIRNRRKNKFYKINKAIFI